MAHALAAAPAPAQVAEHAQFKEVKALAFDAYGTLFDVFSVTALCEELFPGKGTQLAQTWRFKQLQYSLMRSLMGAIGRLVGTALKKAVRCAGIRVDYRWGAGLERGHASDL
jgi:hypothetical protein